MKKIWVLWLSVCISIGMAIQAPAAPAENAGVPSLWVTVEEPDGSGIPGLMPVSTTADAYGFTGEVDIDSASYVPVSVTSGEEVLENAQMLCWGGSAVSASDDAQLVVRDSYIRGETAVKAAPLAGELNSLLTAGNIRTALGTGSSRSFFINSMIAARNGAALSMDEAVPAPEGSAKELSMYTYGAEAITQDGGYGACADLFGSLYVYASHIQAAETGVISGTYGKITIGTNADGESDPVLAAVLTDNDRARREYKQPGSVIQGGRNALMIYSVNRPDYWEYEGYSGEELPLLSASVTAREARLETDMGLSRDIAYEPQQAAYIGHTAGSVVLVKSTNARIALQGCSLIPDLRGTGYLIQTVPGNDAASMNRVPENAIYPGIQVTMKDMEAAGNIAHEDYQRKFSLSLNGTTLTGAVNEYGCEHWNAAAAQEGFADYAPDQAYGTHHGVEIRLTGNAVWNVTGDSRISSLMIGETGRVNGRIYVNGELQANRANSAYEGDILVTPPESSETQQPQTEPGQQAQQPEPETEHVHSWARMDGGSPADCTHDGHKYYICTECGAQYDEILPATGHFYIGIDGWPPTCTEDGGTVYRCDYCWDTYTEAIPAHGHSFAQALKEDPTCTQEGFIVYQCAYCDAIYDETIPAAGHQWSYYSHTEPTCADYGYDTYICDICGAQEAFDYDLYPPTYMHNYEIVYPTPGQESLTHTWQCTECGGTFEEFHNGNYDCFCGWSGAVG